VGAAVSAAWKCQEMRLFLGTRVLHEMPHNGVTKKNNQVADAIAAGHTLLRRERISLELLHHLLPARRRRGDDLISAECEHRVKLILLYLQTCKAHRKSIRAVNIQSRDALLNLLY